MNKPQTNSNNAANNTRLLDTQDAPNTGADILIKRNDAPHMAAKDSSWINVRRFTVAVPVVQIYGA